MASEASQELQDAVLTASTAAARAGVSFDELSALLECLHRTPATSMGPCVWPADIRAAYAIRVWQALPWYKQLWYWVVSAW